MQSVVYQLSSFVLALAIITPAAVIADVYHCALPIPNGHDSVVTDPSTIRQKTVLSIYKQDNGNAQLYIHPVMLDGILPSVGENSQMTSLLMNIPLIGQRITAKDDIIVANFAHNARQQAQKAQAPLQLQDNKLTGFKVSLGVRNEQKIHDQKPTSVIQARIILDWSYKPRHPSGSTAPVYRGAFVASQASLNATGESAQETSALSKSKAHGDVMLNLPSSPMSL